MVKVPTERRCALPDGESVPVRVGFYVLKRWVDGLGDGWVDGKA